MAQLQCSTQEFVQSALTEQQKREAMVRLSKSTNEANGCWAAILAESCLVEIQCGPSFEGSAKDVQIPLLTSGFECLMPWHETQARDEQRPAPMFRYSPNKQSWCPPEELENSELLQAQYFVWLGFFFFFFVLKMYLMHMALNIEFYLKMKHPQNISTFTNPA